MSVDVTVFPARAVDQPIKRRMCHCGNCGTNQYPEVRAYRTTDGQEGYLYLGTCFNCKSVLIAEFKPSGEGKDA